VRAFVRGPLFIWPIVRTYVYIDGFNLYYGAVKGTRFKWLDLHALARTILDPRHNILRLKYFTAIVSARPNDPEKPHRQKTYIRALETFIPNIGVYYGHFLSHRQTAPLAEEREGLKFAKVIRTEEKGSDVNLAVHLLNDAWKGVYDCAVVVSNDSDLAEALKLVREEHRKRIGIISPRRPVSHALRNCADFVRYIHRPTLRACQLPDPIPDTSIRKPHLW